MNVVQAAKKEIAPLAAAHALDSEQQARIPDELMKSLQVHGCFRLLAPKEFGGIEAALPDVLEVIESLAQADASTGWVVGQVASAQLILSYFPLEVIRELYASGPDLLGAGAVAPKGRAVRHEDGWRITGQWPFVTSCERASWIYLQCVLMDGHHVCQQENGLPELRTMLLPAHQAEIVPTWSTAGLCGTASQDVRVSNLFCSDVHSATTTRGRSTLTGPIYRIPCIDQGGLYIAAVAIGIAAAAIADIIDIASKGKRPAFSPKILAASEVFQDQLGFICMQLDCARALLRMKVMQAWDAALEERTLELNDRARLRATVAQVTQIALHVVDTAYSLGGGIAVYNRSTLQRRLRDIHVLSQHAYTGRHHFATLGAILAGQGIAKSPF